MSDTNNWQQAANIALLKQNTLKTEGATQHIQNTMIAEEKARNAILEQENQAQKSSHLTTQLTAELVATKLALEAANELVADWQSAMFAWKDLAQALRDEIKECPNAEAHKFGKNDINRAQRIRTKEDEERASRKLAPKYNPDKTGLIAVH